MKFWFIILFGSLIISCKNGSTTNTQYKEKINNIDSIVYYKPDYTKHIDMILSSGEKGKKESEFWGVNIKDITNLPKTKNRMDYNKTILFAEKYLKKRFHPIDLQFQSIDLETANKYGPNQFSYFVITFSYDKKDYVQKVPMLLDGRIILSNKE